MTEKVQRHYDEMAEVYDRRFDQGSGALVPSTSPSR